MSISVFVATNRVNGRDAAPTARPAAGDALRILYRDRHLIAIDKPPGLLVHRSDVDRHETRFAVQMLRDQIGQRVYPVHRLDRGTSGVLVFALARDIASALGRQFQAGEKRSTYLAVVRGHTEDQGEIEHPLADRADALGGCTASEPRPARTRFLTLARTEWPDRIDRYPTSRFSLVQLQPENGRRHQLRRHLKHIAHPIIGDATYGKGRYNRYVAERFGVSRLLLACVAVRFRHPVDDAEIDLEAPLSGDFERLLRTFGWQTGFLPPCRAEAGPPPKCPMPGSIRRGFIGE